MANDLPAIGDTPASPETEIRKVRIRGETRDVRVPKGMTDDDIARRIAAKSMQPSQGDFYSDFGYGLAETGLGALQLGTMIGKKAGLIPETPVAPAPPQDEGVKLEDKVKQAPPQSETPGRLAGEFVSGAALGGAIGAGTKAIGLGSSLGRNVISGVVPAALQPVDGPDSEFWKEKARQIKTGAMLGYGFSVAGKAANVGTSALMQWIAPRAPGSTDDVAITQILNRINMGTKYGAPTALQMMELMERLGASGKPATMADVGDKNILSLAGHVARQPGPARQIAENFLMRRDDEAFQRLLQDVGVYLKSGPTARQTVNGLFVTRSAASQPLYEQTDALQGIWSPRLREFIGGNTPATRNIMAGMRRGYEIEANTALGEGRPFDPTMLGVDLDEQGNIKILRTPNMRVLDMAKQGLDAMISDERDAITGRLSARGRSLVILRKGYVDELDALDPTGMYKKARETWGGISSNMDAVKVGQTAFSGHPEELAEELTGMTEANREFARIGLADTMRERLMKAGLGTDESRRILKDNGWTKALLKPFFKSEKDYYDFVDAVSAEHTMAATKNSVLKGSQTAERTAEDVSAQSGMMARIARTGRNFLEGRFFDTIREMWLMHRDYARRPDPELNEAIAKMLFAPNVFDTPLGKRLLVQSGMPPAIQNYLAGTPSTMQDILEPALAGGTSAAAASYEGERAGKSKRSVVRKRDPLDTQQ